MDHLLGSVDKVGYEVSRTRREAFTVMGITRLLEPGGHLNVAWFWQELVKGGHIPCLAMASGEPTHLLGMRTWDSACVEGGLRYVAGVEVTSDAMRDRLNDLPDLYAVRVRPSDWLVFHTTWGIYSTRLWADDPFAMVEKLGYCSQAFTDEEIVWPCLTQFPTDYAGRRDDEMRFWVAIKADSQTSQ